MVTFSFSVSSHYKLLQGIISGFDAKNYRCIDIVFMFWLVQPKTEQTGTLLMNSYFQLGDDEARIAIDRCIAELKTRKKTGSVAVADSHGELVGLLRMNGAGLATATIATNKVFTTSRLRQPSGNLGKAAAEGGWDVHYHGDSRYLGWEGGAPVFFQGSCVGSVAVSGLTGEEDFEIAQIGVAAILASLD
jgi:glc operon protein GlcG